MMKPVKLGKRPVLTFVATLDKSMSAFSIEGQNPLHDKIPSAILRRNFPQAKTNTRLKIQFYPWEVDVGRTIWFRNYGHDGELCYTFSRRGKVIQSPLPSHLQKYLKTALSINSGDVVKYKIAVTAI